MNLCLILFIDRIHKVLRVIPNIYFLVFIMVVCSTKIASATCFDFKHSGEVRPRAELCGVQDTCVIISLTGFCGGMWNNSASFLLPSGKDLEKYCDNTKEGDGRCKWTINGTETNGEPWSKVSCQVLDQGLAGTESDPCYQLKEPE